MESERALTAIAYKMIETFGSEAAEKMEAIVADHVEAGDGEGAAFWGDVARTIRRLQFAIAAGNAPLAQNGT